MAKIPKTTANNNHLHPDNHNPKTIFLTPTDDSEVLKIISNLNSNKSAGIDHIPVKTIIHIAKHFIKPLVSMINKSLESAIFPDYLKKVEVVPIFKSGDPNLPANYRPLSSRTLQKYLKKS